MHKRLMNSLGLTDIFGETTIVKRQLHKLIGLF